jgi:hypothetical protein
MKRNRNRSHITYTSAFKVIEELESRRLLSTTITVANTNDSGAGSLRQAIADASAGDTIDLSGVSGTIESSETYNISTDLTLTGPGAGALTVDGNGFASVFKITGGSVAISGLTITQQDTGGELGLSQGGGIYNSANLTLNGVAIRNCSATDLDTAQGGGIYNSGTLSMTDCTISGNRADVTDGDFSADAYGGGIYSSGPLTLTNCTISANSATSDLSSVMFEAMVEAWGGAVYLTGNSPAAFTNCTITGNSVNGTVSTSSPMGIVEALGGAILDSSSNALNLTNCTIVGNSAAGTNLDGPVDADGGGIYQYTGNGGTFTNCIIANNTAPRFPDFHSNNFTSGGHNLIGIFSESGFVNGTNGDQVGSSDTPIDAKLGELADNGGATQTIALLSGSPAINAGDDAKAPATDQRGFDHVGTSDIGAFEYGATGNQAPAFVEGPTTKRVVSGNSFSWTVSATDADHDELSFSSVGDLPSWLSLTDNHDGTATLSGTPANTDAGSHDLSLRVSDGKDHTDIALTLNVALPRWQVSDDQILTVTGTAEGDQIHVWARGDAIRVDRGGEIQNYSRASVKQIEIRGLGGDDMIIVNTRDIPAYVQGNAGNDTLVGGAENDNLVGGGGNDLLDGGAGDDRLDATSGDDKLVGGEGNDRLYGRSGDAILCGGGGADRIHAGAGSNTIFADDSTLDQIWANAHDVVHKDELDVLFQIT